MSANFWERGREGGEPIHPNGTHETMQELGTSGRHTDLTVTETTHKQFPVQLKHDTGVGWVSGRFESKMFSRKMSPMSLRCNVNSRKTETETDGLCQTRHKLAPCVTFLLPRFFRVTI